MYQTKRMIWYVFLLLTGAVLIVLSGLEMVDSMWSGFGGGLAGVALCRLYLGVKYRRNEEYAKKVDISVSDERTLFISGKAKSWAFYLSVLMFAIAGIVFRVLHFDGYANLCLFGVSIMVLIYWIAYVILNRKN